MDEPRKRHFQVGGFQSCVQIVGSSQKQTRHELRNHGKSSKVCTHKTVKYDYQTNHIIKIQQAKLVYKL